MAGLLQRSGLTGRLSQHLMHPNSLRLVVLAYPGHGAAFSSGGGTSWSAFGSKPASSLLRRGLVGRPALQRAVFSSASDPDKDADKKPDKGKPKQVPQAPADGVYDRRRRKPASRLDRLKADIREDIMQRFRGEKPWIKLPQFQPGGLRWWLMDRMVRQKLKPGPVQYAINVFWPFTLVYSTVYVNFLGLTLLLGSRDYLTDYAYDAYPRVSPYWQSWIEDSGFGLFSGGLIFTEAAEWPRLILSLAISIYHYWWSRKAAQLELFGHHPPRDPFEGDAKEIAMSALRFASGQSHLNMRLAGRKRRGAVDPLMAQAMGRKQKNVDQVELDEDEEADPEAKPFAAEKAAMEKDAAAKFRKKVGNKAPPGSGGQQ